MVSKIISRELVRRKLRRRMNNIVHSPPQTSRVDSVRINDARLIAVELGLEEAPLPVELRPPGIPRLCSVGTTT